MCKQATLELKEPSSLSNISFKLLLDGTTNPEFHSLSKVQLVYTT